MSYLPPDTAPRVTIVIITWNQAQMTIDCLRSVQKLTYPCFEVILVDNGSSDNTTALVQEEFPEVTVLVNHQNLGYSEGNNVGIMYSLRSEPDYIFLLNNDTSVDPFLLSHLVKVAESDQHIGIVGPTMFYADPEDMIWAGENRFDWDRMRINRKAMGEHVRREYLETCNPIDIDYVDSCAILIKREVLEKIGVFDNRFFINYDDADFNVRAGKSGYRIIYVPKAIMWHKVSATFGITSPVNTYYMTRNSLLFFTKHTKGAKRFIFFFKTLFGTLRTIIAWSIKSKYRNTLYHNKRLANVYAIRDFIIGRFGKMGPDVSRICLGKM